MVGGRDVDAVLERVEPEAVADLALQLGRIHSPSGGEHEVSDYLFDWCRGEGFSPHRYRVVPEHAANVVACLPGSGTGASLLFNSHMDTAIAAGDDTYALEPDREEYVSALRSGDAVVGLGVVNDKGPMACWLVAARAIRDSGVRLAGDLHLTMVTGEIGHEPVDGSPHALQGKDFGSRYIATHGALADYVIVAETTQFRPVWVEAGKAFFEITVTTGQRGLYTPYLRRPYEGASEPNAVVAAARVVPALEAWALEYEQREGRETPGGRVVPKVNLGAVRAGHPTQPVMTPVTCRLYVDVRLPPQDTPMRVQRELQAVVDACGVTARVRPYLFRRGYEAVGADPVVDSLQRAAQAEGVAPSGSGEATMSSMWRDLNVWNEMGIPAVTFGPGTAGRSSLRVDDLWRCARVYARAALDVCGVR